MLTRTIEALLFASGKPIALTTLSKLLHISAGEVQEALKQLSEMRNIDASGIHILIHDGKAQYVTHPQEGEIVQSFLKEEVSGELTQPSLETLTIIAYRGPITKPEIEQIRGVNCSLILRNLLIRGLIEEKEDKQRLQNTYTISFDFLRHLGADRVEELPQYSDLHTDEVVGQLIQETF
ncbi:TPA: SMC-Scp complex subunit ScpB [Candidatus Uhrbacteria bacterium]|uniref:Segregation and condensation protein B n=2 Tax=Candidatus Uhriibacteriota TaxID=1752732 RepID=A0A0G1T747_9BACT|nr:MAG: Segregation and condensation protein B [Candidatus Uhrbacteria bacterium GW2011_GWF2_46_218]KKU41215.1 MAG: Segregation and condensation protein B [Candidatus Uhrbacteria bacterium GW2011_GWE2_46_68]HBK34064.1 SMC-Scp complex subunit ScpB [Candidatus Uhrbacteria bacterium]HCB18858.1 SMC-Scp complex subunit ScpB [Candidatus Uhrbacteria bacterium]